MKLALLSLGFLLVVNVHAVELNGSMLDESRPKSFFKAGERDPFAMPRKKVDDNNTKAPTETVVLKCVSRGAKESVALLGKVALVEGEAVTCKVGGAAVKVTCKEIRDESVIIQVGNNPSLIRLKIGGSFKFDTNGFQAPLQPID